MPRYFFDCRDGDSFIEDDEGLVLPNVETCKREAARSLAEMAREVLPGTVGRDLTIEVLDERKRPLFRSVLVFKVQPSA